VREFHLIPPLPLLKSNPQFSVLYRRRIAGACRSQIFQNINTNFLKASIKEKVTMSSINYSAEEV